MRSAIHKCWEPLDLPFNETLSGIVEVDGELPKTCEGLSDFLDDRDDILAEAGRVTWSARICR